MLFLSIFLVVFSPYMAFLPIAFTGILLLQRGSYVLKNTWNLGLMFLFMWSFFVGVSNDNPISTIASLGFLFYLFIGIYLQNYYNEENEIEKLFKYVVLVSLASAFIGILERFTPLNDVSTWWKQLFGIYPQVVFSETQRISGTSGNPNIAGAWYAAMVLICLYFFQRSDKYKKAAYGLGIVLFFGVLMLTESRGATIGLVLGLIAYSYLMGHKRSMLALSLILFSGVMLMFIFPDWFPRGHNLLDSVMDRREIWRNCLNMFKYKPVTGWGLLGIYYAGGDVYHYTRTYHGHNFWITIATTLGFVGLSVFVYMKYQLLQELKLLTQNNCRLAPLLAGLLAIILGQGLIDFTIMNPQGGIIFFGSSALISGLACQYDYFTVRDFYTASLRVKNRKI